MQKTLSFKADNSSAGQEIPCLFLNLEDLLRRTQEPTAVLILIGTRHNSFFPSTPRSSK